MGQPDPALVGRWTSVSPRKDGVQFDANGYGNVIPTGNVIAKGPLFSWGSEGGKLRLLFYGEEGEHGEPEERSYWLQDDRLRLFYGFTYLDTTEFRKVVPGAPRQGTVRDAPKLSGRTKRT